MALAEEPAHPEESSRAGILVASGDPRESREIHAALTAEGCAVSVAPGGEEALHALSAGTSGDLELCDLVVMGLPLTGPYGRLVVEALGRARCPESVPVLAIVPQDEPDECERALAAGASEILQRPVHTPELTVRIRSLLELGRLRREVEEARAQGNEARERLAASMAERSRFGRLVAHDLKNPLTGILGHAQMIEPRVAEACPDAVRHVARILEASVQIQKILSDVRDLGLLEEGRYTLGADRVDLRGTAEMVIEEQRSAAESCGVDLELVAAGGRSGPRIVADVGLLMRAMGNLIADAVRHSPADGVVRLVIGAPSDGHVEMHLSAVTKDLGDDATTSDDVPPPPDRALPAAPRPAGLRLAFCRAALAALGARIWEKPNAAGGSTFGILLPLGAEGRR